MCFLPPHADAPVSQSSQPSCSSGAHGVANSPTGRPEVGEQRVYATSPDTASICRTLLSLLRSSTATLLDVLCCPACIVTWARPPSDVPPLAECVANMERCQAAVDRS